MDEGSLDRVAAEVKQCTLCSLAVTRTNAVPGEGNPSARVVMVGEGPGRNEDLQGKPFVGAAGKQLDVFLSLAGLKREEVYITNIVKCRPPENRRPTPAEAEACRPYLLRQLGHIRPQFVVLLGDTALKQFLPNQTLTAAHGKLFPNLAFTLFPTYHPAAVIYNRSLEEVIKEDFRALGRHLSER